MRGRAKPNEYQRQLPGSIKQELGPPQEVPRYSRAVDCNVRGGEEHGVQHQSGHDWIQELVGGVGVGLLFLLLPVCVGLKGRRDGKARTGTLASKQTNAPSAVVFRKHLYAGGTFILSAMSSKATIMSPGLFIFFSTRSVWEKRVGEYDRPSFGTVAQKFSSSLLKEKRGEKHSLRGGKNK